MENRRSLILGLGSLAAIVLEKISFDETLQEFETGTSEGLIANYATIAGQRDYFIWIQHRGVGSQVYIS